MSTARVIRLHAIGGPEVLCLERVEVGEPGPGQAREISKIGVFYDTVETSLLANGFAPNRPGAHQGFLRKVA